MTSTFQGDLFPKRRIRGVEPIVGPDNECSHIVIHTPTELLRVRVTNETWNPQCSALKFSKSFLKCSREHTIVCASNDVAVIADASGRSDAHVLRFDPRSCRCPSHVSPPTVLSMSSTLLTAAVTPDSKLVVGGTREGQIKVWSVMDGVLLHTFTEKHNDWVTCVKVSALSGSGLSGLPDVKYRYTAISMAMDDSVLVHFIGPSTFVTRSFPSDDDESAMQDEEREEGTQEKDRGYDEDCATSGEDGAFGDDDDDDDEFDTRGNLACVDISADGRLALFGYNNGSLVLWDLTTGALREDNEGKPRLVQEWCMWEAANSIRFHPTRFEALVPFHGGWLHRVDLETGERVSSIFNSAESSSLAHCAWIGDSLRFVLSRGKSLWTGEAGRDSEEEEEEWDEDA